MPVISSDVFSEVPEEEIIISGFSGRFPESSNVEEFKNNLFNGVDMVNDEPRRWPSGMYGLPARLGKLKEEDMESFDQIFFGVHHKQSDVMDPGVRILLEATHEAIIDSGYNPQDLRGSLTGVYVGVSGCDIEYYLCNNPTTTNDYVVSGFLKTFYANRLSFAFDFRGPSIAIDTGCSSSIYAMAQAFQDIRAGRCDAAIVAGVSVSLNPFFTLTFKKSNIHSEDGACKAFDKSANGYVRAEGCVVAFIQRAKYSRRVYATILNVRTNVDGAKTQGFHHPSGGMQKQLIQETIQEINLDPNDVVYVETHGTGTKVGDPEEVNGLCDFFCKNRQTPLLIGSVKSNMGHAEPASGLCSIAKVLIAMEEGVIPGNLHYKNPNPEIYGIMDGRLKVVDKNIPWSGGIIALNSFGLGGANAHLIMKSNPKVKNIRPWDDIPRLAVVSGRTIEAVKLLLEDIEIHAEDDEYMALVNEIHTKNIPLHNYRGYAVVHKGDPVQEVIELDELNRPIWFIYSGVGSQWAHMAKDLMQIDVFSNSIHKCADILLSVDIDLFDIVINLKKFTIMECFVAITSIQVALTDMLRHIGIMPEGFVGHSVGELGCAYADGCLTLEQAVLSAYWRGKSILDAKSIRGTMAAIGLSWNECLKRLPKDISLACHNNIDSVTICGPIESVKNIIGTLTKEGVFAKEVESTGIALHSKYISDAGPKLLEALDKIIPNPKNRTKKWISSSVPEMKWSTPLAKQCSSAYQVNNLVSPVLFYEALQHIPKNAICIEVAPHGILQAIMMRALEKDVTNLSLMKRNHENNAQFLLSNIGKLYGAGAHPLVSKLYAPVSFPVSRGTSMLNSKIRWDHSEKFSKFCFVSTTNSREAIVEINLLNKEYAFISGHTLDGRILFPGAGYIVLAWRQFAKIHDTTYDKLPVVLEDIVFHRVTVLPLNTTIKFRIVFLEGTSKFEICEGSSLVASGTIRVPENVDNEESQLDPISNHNNGLQMDVKDIYKEFRIRGYDYSGSFRSLIETNVSLGISKIKWEKNNFDNWVSLIDSAPQFYILTKEYREFYLLKRVQKIIINPVKHLKLAEMYRTNEGKVIYPAYAYRNIDIYKCGGVEISQATLSLASKRHGEQDQPTLEQYTFLPHYNNYNLSEEKGIAKELSITCAVHLVIENSKRALRIKTTELLMDQEPETLLSTIVRRAIENEPILGSDVTIVAASNIPELEQKVNDTGVRIVVKDITTGPIDSGSHLCIGTDILTQPNAEVILRNLKNSIKDDGFILLEESANSIGEMFFAKLNMVVVYQQMCSNRQYLLVRPLLDNTLQISQVIHVTEKNFDWLENLKVALKRAETDNNLVYIVCQGEKLFGALGFMNCIKNEEYGKFARLFFIQDTNAEIFSQSNPFYEQQIQKNLIVNVLKNNVWGYYRHLKLVYKQNVPTKLVEHAYVNCIMRGNLSSLKWIESPLSHNLPSDTDKNVELCTVYYAALNFRDIMVSSGNLPTDALKEELVHNESLLGLEFSGRDSKGNRVMGMLTGKGLATTCVIDKNLMWNVPVFWTLEEASTVPCVYITAYYALVIRGQIKEGESILIHAGSGGVGQAAIRLALNVGLTVYTTVGTKEKREFIMKTFPQLTDRHIGNSRDCSFKQLIMEETKGRGVDLVLNSLAEDKLQASIMCLGLNGRFLEIGKYDIINNNSLGMSVFLKNVSFHGVHLDYILNCDTETINKVGQLLNDGITNGVVRPLQTTIFDDQHLEQAFRFMASGKHIGKVVIKLREEEEQKQIIPSLKLITAIPRTFMYNKKTYVIIGGLGGFGLELIHWLISRGARNIVASSRSGIKTGYQHYLMQQWQQTGVNVVVDKNEVTTLNGVHQLLTEASQLGPIGGIFNLAAVIRDSALENQNEDDFRAVCLPKVTATTYLDTVSRTLCPELDYFVCFSSVSCGRGNAGQSNYGLANSTMERICEARQAAGYPGTAIQWGAIGDTGIIIEQLGDNNTVVGGTLPQRMTSCLHTMDLFLHQPHPVLASMVVAQKNKTDVDGINNLASTIGNIFGIKDVNTIRQSLTLVDLGLDSLMTQEIKQTLERDYNLVMNNQQIRQLSFEKLHNIEMDKILNNH